jgi:putative protease
MELVSPAGSLEKLKFAIDFGADAVYAGGKIFSLRSLSGMSLQELEEGIKYAHERGKKVYLTLNAFLRNADLENFRSFVKDVSRLEPDGIVVSDLGALRILREVAPSIPVHVSTQANITNYEAVKFLKDAGVKRIILARELSLKEVREIKRFVPEVEIEVFVHGALCMAYSGRCFLSLYLTGRDANRGECTQCCRWKYYVVEEKRKEGFLVEESEEGTFIFNSKDLCAVELIPELISAGVDAVKIEGRNKSVYYCALTTMIYKEAIKVALESPSEFEKRVKFFLEELDKVSHRPYTKGFLGGEKELQHTKTSSYIRKCSFLATYEKGKWKVRNPFKVGEVVEVVAPGMKIVKEKIGVIIKEGKRVESAQTNDEVEIPNVKVEAERALMRRCFAENQT